MTDKAKTMTMAAYGRRHGVSKVTVGKWRKRGILRMAGELVDVAASDERLAGRPARYRGGASRDRTRQAVKAATAAKPAGLARAIERKETALAELREMQLAIKRGRYCDIEETGRQLEGMFAVIRERALSLPGTLADRIAMQPRHICLDLLQVEVNAMLTDLSDSAAAEIAERAAREAKGDGTS